MDFKRQQRQGMGMPRALACAVRARAVVYSLLRASSVPALRLQALCLPVA